MTVHTGQSLAFFNTSQVSALRALSLFDFIYLLIGLVKIDSPPKFLRRFRRRRSYIPCLISYNQVVTIEVGLTHTFKYNRIHFFTPIIQRHLPNGTLAKCP